MILPTHKTRIRIGNILEEPLLLKTGDEVVLTVKDLAGTADRIPVEEALEQYLDVNEWQIKGIQDALIEADNRDAVFVDHHEVLAQREARFAR